MAVLPKEIYNFKAIPIKSQTKFFTDLERIIINFIMKSKIPGRNKTILYNKVTSRGITNPAIKLYYRTKVMKTA